MGSSVGVTTARTVDEVAEGIRVALSYDDRVLVEEAVAGREIEVAVLGNEVPRASVPGEIVPVVPAVPAEPVGLAGPPDPAAGAAGTDITVVQPPAAPDRR